MSRLIRLVAIITILVGCKVEISVPGGGYIASSSGAYDCASDQVCFVEVNDFHFVEDFVAKPWQGWVFMGWKSGWRQLCHDRDEVCTISTIGFEEYEDLAAIVESDETFYLEPEFIQGTPIDQALVRVRDDILRACLDDQIEETGPLKYAEQLTRLECSSVTSIEGIEAFVGLEYLLLEDFENELIVLDSLAALIRLKSPGLIGNGDDETFSDVSSLAGPLAALTQLKHLDLSGNGIADLSPLADPFAGLKRLKSLELTGNEFSDISALAGLKRLQSLNLLANPFLSDIGPLVELKWLKTLNLAGNDIRNISALAGLTRLQSLNLSGLFVNDISPLAGLTQLQSLSLHGANISDISPLAGLIRLQFLDLANNTISDISPLDALTRMEDLDLRRNLISDIGALKQLYPPPGDPTVRIKLDLSSKQISSVVDALDGIANGDVYLSGNPLSCEEARSLVSNDEEPTVRYFPLPGDFPPGSPAPLPVDCV